MVPDADVGMHAGRDPNGTGENLWLDITRLREHTGYEPEYDVQRGVRDYIDWLRGGNQRRTLYADQKTGTPSRTSRQLGVKKSAGSIAPFACAQSMSSCRISCCWL